MQKALIGIILLVVAIGIIGYFAWSPDRERYSADEDSMLDTDMTDADDVDTQETTQQDIDEAEEEVEIVEVTLRASNFAFSEETIAVEEGQLVRLTLISDEGLHDFIIDEIDGAFTSRLGAGEQETIEFFATEAGTYSFYCSVGEHRVLGMEGTLIVE